MTIWQIISKRVRDARLRRWVQNPHRDWQWTYVYPLTGTHIVISDLGPSMETRDERYEVEVSWTHTGRVRLRYFKSLRKAKRFARSQGEYRPTGKDKRRG